VALDQQIDIVETEMDLVKRQEAVNRSVQIVQDEVLVIPLHRQVIPWASRAGMQVTHRANNTLQPQTVKMP
jgi:peptide/nickel transport system substrate-binding protein